MRTVDLKAFSVVKVASLLWFRAPRVVTSFLNSGVQRQLRRIDPSQHQIGHIRRYFSSEPSVNVKNDDDNDDDNDLLRWERMYGGGGLSRSDHDDGDMATEVSAREIRVVTFDLDNTLWRTSPTISAANNALAEFLNQRGIVQPVRVETIMGQLFQASRKRYCPDGSEDDKAPVLLTLLRKDAVKQVLLDHNDYSDDDAAEFAEQAFEVWTNARHDAIPLNLASSVIPCLQKISELRTSLGQPVLVGAITDGNSDPRNVPAIGDFFHFCVNAESVGVSKPDKRVYLEALNQVTSHPFMQDVFGPLQRELREEAVEDLVGSWWVHIGDDFIKDVVASKSMKMRSIWARELLPQPQAPAKANVPAKSVEEFVKTVSDMKVIEMTVGADDYLADSLRQEFADAVVERFDELGDILTKWQLNAMQPRIPPLNDCPPTAPINYAVVMETDAPQRLAGDIATKTKFCVFCGTKLPCDAKFCLSCGEKQPNLTD